MSETIAITGKSVKLFKGHYTSSMFGPWKSSDALRCRREMCQWLSLRMNAKKMVERLCCY
ncbi:MAG: hypothetical protein ACREYE_09215 [Gammaproteobacteria bacterium]